MIGRKDGEVDLVISHLTSAIPTGITGTNAAPTALGPGHVAVARLAAGPMVSHRAPVTPRPFPPSPALTLTATGVTSIWN